VVDECHRGSARDERNWREILDYFQPAYQLGMTATPLREDNRDTYLYFGNPLYTYSLKQGIADGFLAPYRVHRVLTTYDAAGWRPNKRQMEIHGREIPDGDYQTKDFERTGGVSLQARTEAIARHLSDFLKKTSRYAKTIVFCVDQEHADQMRRALNNQNADLVQELKKRGDELSRCSRRCATPPAIPASSTRPGPSFVSRSQSPIRSSGSGFSTGLRHRRLPG
jgi:type I restriction enzyme R subunit